MCAFAEGDRAAGPTVRGSACSDALDHGPGPYQGSVVPIIGGVQLALVPGARSTVGNRQRPAFFEWAGAPPADRQIMPNSILGRPPRVMTRTVWRLLFVLSVFAALLGLLAPASMLLELKIWVVSWLPMATEMEQIDALHDIDKWVHLGIFLGLGGLGARAWCQRAERWRILFGLLLMAFVTEALQYFVPGRSASLGDLGADLAGLGLLVVILLLPRGMSVPCREES